MKVLADKECRYKQINAQYKQIRDAGNEREQGMQESERRGSGDAGVGI